MSAYLPGRGDTALEGTGSGHGAVEMVPSCMVAFSVIWTNRLLSSNLNCGWVLESLSPLGYTVNCTMWKLQLLGISHYSQDKSHWSQRPHKKENYMIFCSLPLLFTQLWGWQLILETPGSSESGMELCSRSCFCPAVLRWPNSTNTHFLFDSGHTRRLSAVCLTFCRESPLFPCNLTSSCHSQAAGLSFFSLGEICCCLSLLEGLRHCHLLLPSVLDEGKEGTGSRGRKAYRWARKWFLTSVLKFFFFAFSPTSTHWGKCLWLGFG